MRRNRWRSCKDRLPHRPKYSFDVYLITDGDAEHPYTAYWDGKRWTDDRGFVIDTVIAWRKIPAKYFPREDK